MLIILLCASSPSCKKDPAPEPPPKEEPDTPQEPDDPEEPEEPDNPENPDEPKEEVLQNSTYPGLIGEFSYSTKTSASIWSFDKTNKAIRKTFGWNKILERWDDIENIECSWKIENGAFSYRQWNTSNDFQAYSFEFIDSYTIRIYDEIYHSEGPETTREFDSPKADSYAFLDDDKMHKTTWVFDGTNKAVTADWIRLTENNPWVVVNTEVLQWKTVDDTIYTRKWGSSSFFQSRYFNQNDDENINIGGEIYSKEYPIEEPIIDQPVVTFINSWSRHAQISANGINGQDNGFEIKETAGTSWEKVNRKNITSSGDKFNAYISGLKPGTSYTVRAYSGEKTSQEIVFGTEQEMKIPNAGFNIWYKDGKSWMPNIDMTYENYWWDSWNRSVNTLGEKNTTEPEYSTKIEGNAAARLGSTKMLSVFAPGCIYSGYFIERVGFGSKISLGQPYTSRPIRMRGYYKYTPGVIDFAKYPYGNLNGQLDNCHIYVALADWDYPFIVNTTTETFLNLQNDPGIIAFGELSSNTSTGGYRSFSIELNYKSETRKPKYIVIWASASKYGDRYTGSTSSVLYLDDLSLEFE